MKEPRIRANTVPAAFSTTSQRPHFTCKQMARINSLIVIVTDIFVLEINTSLNIRFYYFCKLNTECEGQVSQIHGLKRVP